MKYLYGKRKCIIEIGSTNTKCYINEDKKIKELPQVLIPFKVNYINNNNTLVKVDIEELFKYIDNVKHNEMVDDIYVYGTSLFRDLNEVSLIDFKNEIENRCKCKFYVVTSEQETYYTAFGVVNDLQYDGNIAVMIAGGGSTEVAVVKDSKIIEQVHNNIGAIDILNKFKLTADEISGVNIDSVNSYLLEVLQQVKNKSDVLIVTGGIFLTTFDKIGYPLINNNLFSHHGQPKMVTKKNFELYNKKYFNEVPLSRLKATTPENPDFWNGSRVMSCMIDMVATITKSKYIIPTNIPMVYGIIEELNK